MTTASTKRKTLGVFSLVMINIIAVDSLRTLPFSAEYGYSLVFYYILAAIIFFIPVALVSAELATGWPDRGGIYVWVREAFGDRMGFIVIWLQWIYNVVWYPTILSFVAGAIAYLIDPQLAKNKAFMLSIVLGIFWGATLINCFGMKISSWVSTAGALVGTLIPMAFIMALGVFWLYQGRYNEIIFSWKTFWPDGNSMSNIAFFLALLFGLIGVELSAVHADEVKDPGRAYPKAILISTAIVLFTLVFSSLALAVIVPHGQLDVVTGLVQAFQIFFVDYHVRWLEPLVTLLIILGGICGVATWIIGPTKGLLVATQDGSAPPLFAKMNKRGVPVVILFFQAILLTLLCAVFLLMPSVSSSYWVLTAMTAQLAMLVYLLLFAAAIYLRYKSPEVPRAYRVPGGLLGMWVVGVLGSLSCIVAILIGFFPPAEIHIGSLWVYESILIVGIIVLSVPPLIIYAMKKPSWGE